MGRACGMCGLGKMCAGFGWEKCKEREYIEDLGMAAEIILKRILIKDIEYIVFMC